MGRCFVDSSNRRSRLTCYAKRPSKPKPWRPPGRGDSPAEPPVRDGPCFSGRDRRTQRVSGARLHRSSGGPGAHICTRSTVRDADCRPDVVSRRQVRDRARRTHRLHSSAGSALEWIGAHVRSARQDRARVAHERDVRPNISDALHPHRGAAAGGVAFALRRPDVAARPKRSIHADTGSDRSTRLHRAAAASPDAPAGSRSNRPSCARLGYSKPACRL